MRIKALLEKCEAMTILTNKTNEYYDLIKTVEIIF